MLWNSNNFIRNSRIGLEKYDPDQEHDESKIKYFEN